MARPGQQGLLVPQKSLLVPKSYNKVNARPPIKSTEATETFTVPCPYEPIGKAVVETTVVRENGIPVKRQIDLGEPRRCDTCGKWFKLATKTVMTGIPMDQPPAAPVKLHDDAYDPTMALPPGASTVGHEDWVKAVTAPTRNRDGSDPYD